MDFEKKTNFHDNHKIFPKVLLKVSSTIIEIFNPKNILQYLNIILKGVLKTLWFLSFSA